ncbi:acyltransferase [Sphingobacterium phlebotomi]|uniref:Acyltransferase n=1 Tax=Sphingobacterium phlebotomi TaxID=2605433 RepID=A0A5D4H714_9SPHI|nr:acyltransferase [Sphingobacterium phlebotomi]TYR36841.1 acyltransferase [Sphingobacterium phlebotomi]
MTNLLKKIWLDVFYRRLNTENWARKKGAKVGKNCRLLNITFSSEPYLVEIGDHVSATSVHFETHDGGIWVFRDKHRSWDIIKPIKIGNNVYLGLDVIVLPGVTIGDNVVVGARSIVTKDIPANSVVAGIPARVIKSIDEYYEKVKQDVKDTKLMRSSDKKKFYLNYFKQWQKD